MYFITVFKYNIHEIIHQENSAYVKIIYRI